MKLESAKGEIVIYDLRFTIYDGRFTIYDLRFTIYDWRWTMDKIFTKVVNIHYPLSNHPPPTEMERG